MPVRAANTGARLRASIAIGTVSSAMQIRHKLGLGLGIIVALFFLIGVVAYQQIEQINRNTALLVDVRGPRQEAILQMEIDLQQLARAVLHNSIALETVDRVAVDQAKASFLRHAQEFYDLTEASEQRAGIQGLVTQFDRFVTIGEQMMLVAEYRNEDVIRLREEIALIDNLLDEELQSRIDPATPTAMTRLQAALEMEVNAYEAFAAIRDYVILPGEPARARLQDAVEDFVWYFAVYRSSSPSADELVTLTAIEEHFSATVGTGEETMARTDRLVEWRAKFEQEFSHIETTLKQSMQPSVRLAIDAAELEARNISTAAEIFITTAVLSGAGVVVVIALLLLNQVADPLRRLMVAATEIGRGNRVALPKADASGEIGLLIKTLESMLADLDRTAISRSYLDQVLSSLVVGVAVLDVDGLIRHANPKMLRMVGRAEDALIDRPIDDVLRGGPAASDWSTCVFGEEGITNREGYVVGEGEAEVPVVYSAVAMYDESGDISFIVVTVLDFSAQRAAMNALAESEQRFKDFALATSDWYWETGENDEFVYISERFFQVMHVDPATILGKNRRGFVSEAELERDPQKWHNHFGDLDAHRPFRNLEYEIVGSDGEPRFISVNGVPYFNKGGRFRGYRGADNDVTERRQLELEREALQRELSQAQKMEALGTLAGGVAHEINTPIQYIGDNIQFMREAFTTLTELIASYSSKLATTAGATDSSSEPAEQKDASAPDLEFLEEEVPLAIEQSLDGVRRIAEIVQAIKEFSHPGAKGKAPIDLNHAIRAAGTVTRNQWKYVADMEMELDQSLPTLPCVAGEINQVLLNLIVNAAHAIEATNKHGRIVFGTRACDGCVELRLSDTGIGIPKENIEKMFEPFFTTKEVGKGTGQGLAIVHRIVTKTHGGTIEVESEPNIGTTFIIRLPLVGDDQPNAAADAASTAGGSGAQSAPSGGDLRRSLTQ